MRALITRPREDAEPLAARLREMGVDPVIAPLIEIVPRADAIAEFDLAGVLAVLITSANGARMLARATERRDLRLFAVGDASAAVARDLGFTGVDSAGGDVSALAQLVYASLPSDGGPLVHIAGSDVAGDLSGALERAGFTVHRAVLYDQQPASNLPPSAGKALTQGTIEAVLLYSPRTAATFAGLVRKARLETGLAEVTAYCLSENVAARARDLPWKALRIAADPEQGALLELVAADLAAAAPRELLADDGPEDTTSENAAPLEVVPEEQKLQEAEMREKEEVHQEDASPQEEISSQKAGPVDVAADGSAVEPEVAARPVRRRRWAAPVFVLVAAVAGAALAWPWIEREAVPMLRSWLPEGMIAAPAPEESGPLAVLERRLAELESVARDLPARTALAEAEARSRAAIAAMEAHLAALRDEIASLSARPATAPGVPAEEAARMAARIQEQQARIESQEKTLVAFAARLAEVETESAGPPRGAARLLAVGQLAATVEDGRGYAAEIAALDSLLAEGPDPTTAEALALLRPRAEAGVPTRADLRQRLPGLARRVLAAPAHSGAPGWLERVSLRLATIVTVRRTADGLPAGGPGPDAGADELLARAEARLAVSDLAGAIAAMERLDGPRAAVAADWLSDAKARHGVDTALAALRRVAVAGISGPAMDRAMDDRAGAPTPDAGAKDAGAKDAGGDAR